MITVWTKQTIEWFPSLAQLAGQVYLSRVQNMQVDCGG